MSKGELYTFVTNKSNNGRKGSLVACIKGTKSEDLICALQKIPLVEREKVREMSLDMAPNMALASKSCFTNSRLVIDRFHVVKLANEALQHLRIKERWSAIDQENEAIREAKKKGEKYSAPELKNGDTLKQLLARSRYVIAKKQNQWGANQKQRAELLFAKFPLLEKGYHLTMELRSIFEETLRDKAEIKFKNWIKKAVEFEKDIFRTVANSIENHLENILNFFNNRSTNANAESFNARIKLLTYPFN